MAGSIERRNARPAGLIVAGLGRYAILVAVAGLILIPIGYAILGGFKSNGQLVGDPVSVLPNPWVFSNYTDVLFGVNAAAFWKEAANSLIIAAIAVTATVGLASLAAFVFARMVFRGREAIYTLFVFGLLFPSAVAILPLYILVRQLGLSGRSARRGAPAGRLRAAADDHRPPPFFRSIPVELEDAARIDGCGLVRASGGPVATGNDPRLRR